MKLIHLIRKEIFFEWRQKYAFSGILLYVFATLFIIQKSLFFVNMTTVSKDIWIAFFWIIILFASVNAAAKSFIQEGKGRLLYYYILASAEEMILSKFIYNSLLLLLVSVITYIGFNILLGNFIENSNYFWLLILVGSIGFAASFTMVSGIAHKANGSGTLMTILSFPVIIPQLLLLVRLSRKAAFGLNMADGNNDLLMLLSINGLVLVASYVLFPYLWRE